MWYYPGKAHDRGTKLYKLTRPSGYVLKTIIDLGKDTIYNDTGISNFEVFKEGKNDFLGMNLMENYLNNYVHLYMDNFFTSSNWRLCYLSTILI